MQDLRQLVHILQYITTIYRINFAKNMRDYSLCLKFSEYSEWLIKSVLIFYSGFFVVFECILVYEYIAAPASTFYTHFPTVHANFIASGDIAMLVSHFGIIFLVTFVAWAFDTLVFMAFLNVPLIAIIIVRDLDGLQKKLNNDPMDRIEMHRGLVKIIRMLKKYKE